jgi:hypothetical protein
MSYSQPFQVECFYSCDKNLAMSVLAGKENLNKSTNPWDWLGKPHLIQLDPHFRREKRFIQVLISQSVSIFKFVYKTLI